MIEIDFIPTDNWLDGPLPVPADNRPPSGWAGLERSMPNLVERFCDSRGYALELGVEYGHSTTVLAQLFGHVTGVDWFKGDPHSGEREDYYQVARSNIARWRNVTLVQEEYQRWITHDRQNYDLIHIDMYHDFEATYRAGIWAVEHAPVVLFHDTIAWPEVAPAVERIAKETGLTFYNYPHNNGLGILA